MQGGGELGGARGRGRKDGEGRIDSNPNNNKAIKGRPRPAPRALRFPEIWGVEGVEGWSWSVASCEEWKGVGVAGAEAVSRGTACVWMPTRVVFWCDSARRPPRLLGRVDDALWARSRGWRLCFGGRRAVQDVSHRRLHTEGVTGLRGELCVCVWWGRPGQRGAGDKDSLNLENAKENQKIPEGPDPLRKDPCPSAWEREKSRHKC